MDGKLATPDRALAEIAQRQHGVVSAGQLHRCGITDDAIRSRVISGRLHRVHRGVYSVGHRSLSLRGRWMAAVLAVGRGSARAGDSMLDYWGIAVSHRSAAVLWGMLSAKPGPVDVTVPGDGGRSKRSGIRIHRSRVLAPVEVVSRERVPVTTSARTIADLRASLVAGRPGSVSPRELRKAIRQANVLGLPVDEENRGDRTRSDLESDFIELCRRHRLRSPEVNVRVGAYLADFLWPERRLIVETDFYLYHRGRVAFQDDRGRDLELRRLGYEVVRLSEKQIDEEADLVAEILVTALSEGSGASGDRRPA